MNTHPFWIGVLLLYVGGAALVIYGYFVVRKDRKERKDK